jgi:hypothetical protein
MTYDDYLNRNKPNIPPPVGYTGIAVAPQRPWPPVEVPVVKPLLPPSRYSTTQVEYAPGTRIPVTYYDPNVDTLNSYGNFAGFGNDIEY